MAYTQSTMAALLLISAFGIIRFSALIPILATILLLGAFLATNLIIAIECNMISFQKPCSKLFRNYKQVFWKSKYMNALLRSFTPLQLNIGYNFVRIRKRVYLVSIIRLSRVLSSLLATYPTELLYTEFNRY